MSNTQTTPTDLARQANHREACEATTHPGGGKKQSVKCALKALFLTSINFLSVAKGRPAPVRKTVSARLVLRPRRWLERGQQGGVLLLQGLQLAGQACGPLPRL